LHKHFEFLGRLDDIEPKVCTSAAGRRPGSAGISTARTIAGAIVPVRRNKERGFSFIGDKVVVKIIRKKIQCFGCEPGA
jgi:hypothetical protein